MALIFLTGSSITIGQSALPEDVVVFSEKRDGCDHFRGEYPYNEERRKFLLKNITELCTGTDSDLVKLKEKYKENSLVLEKLASYEKSIEANK